MDNLYLYICIYLWTRPLRFDYLHVAGPEIAHFMQVNLQLWRAHQKTTRNIFERQLTEKFIFSFVFFELTFIKIAYFMQVNLSIFDRQVILQ